MNLSLDSLQPGMVVSAEVRDRGGRVLVPSGTALTEKHIRAFKCWGVPEVLISDDSTDAVPAPGANVPPEIFEAAEAKLAERFRNVDCENPLIAVVFQRALQLEIEHRLGKSGGEES